jgi:hypothetical protein
MNKATILFDYDPILYQAASAGEKRTIKVIHKDSGDELEFKTRTEFWGHFKKKAGGYLAEYNAGRTSPRLPREFVIEDVQIAEPIENCISITKSIIKGITEAIGTKKYYGYSGVGKVFREDVSTIIKYKGNRDSLLRPVHLNELKQYLVKHQDCSIIETIEADDKCSMDSFDAYQKWKKTKADKDKLVLAFVDKDYLQCAGHLYNTNTADGICSYEGFGWLKLNDKGDVKGRGRMWLFHQILAGDTSDNYFANSASAVKWADMSSYKLLKDCKNDKEALQALVTGYKMLYPSPKEITGWRGDKIMIDWKYVLQENTTLAFMLRKPEDSIDIAKLLTKLEIET